MYSERGKIIVDKLMAKSVYSVGMDGSLRELKKVFEETKFHQILVVDETQWSPNLQK